MTSQPHQTTGPLEPGDPGFRDSPTVEAARHYEPVAQDEPIEWVDYFSYTEEHVFTLPDGRQTITFEVMTEGKKAEFQRATNSGVQIDRRSGNAKVNMDPAQERHELIKASVTGWTLQKIDRNTKRPFPVPFSKNALQDFLVYANPKVVEDLEKAIREANPWMATDNMTVEAVDQEINRLRDLRETLVERERGEASSVSK